MTTSIYGGMKLHVLVYIVLSQTMAHARFFIVSLDNGVLRFNPLFCSDVLSEIGNNFIFFFYFTSENLCPCESFVGTCQCVL